MTELSQILNLLDRVRREWHAARIFGGLSTFVVLCLGVTLAFVLAAIWLPLPDAARWIILAVWAACLLVSAVLLVFRRLLENPTRSRLLPWTTVRPR